jgi:hypothetical protein
MRAQCVRVTGECAEAKGEEEGAALDVASDG